MHDRCLVRRAAEGRRRGGRVGGVEEEEGVEGGGRRAATARRSWGFLGLEDDGVDVPAAVEVEAELEGECGLILIFLETKDVELDVSFPRPFPTQPLSVPCLFFDKEPAEDECPPMSPRRSFSAAASTLPSLSRMAQRRTS